MIRRPGVIWKATLLAGLLLALAALWSSAAEPVSIDWYAVVSGGGQASSADLVLQGTAGQAAVGSLSGGELLLGAGYWGDTAAAQPPSGQAMFLPLVPRS